MAMRLMNHYDSGAIRENDDNRFKLTVTDSTMFRKMIYENGLGELDEIDTDGEVETTYAYTIETKIIKDMALRLEGWLKNSDNSRYDLDNWLKGIPVDRSINGIFRHLYAYMNEDTSCDHLAAILFGIASIMVTEELVKKEELDLEYLSKG